MSPFVKKTKMSFKTSKIKLQSIQVEKYISNIVLSMLCSYLSLFDLFCFFLFWVKHKMFCLLFKSLDVCDFVFNFQIFGDDSFKVCLPINLLNGRS